MKFNLLPESSHELETTALRPNKRHANPQFMESSGTMRSQDEQALKY